MEISLFQIEISLILIEISLILIEISLFQIEISLFRNRDISISKIEISLSLYISSLVQEGASVSKIDQAVYSIAWAHQIAGLDSPCDSVLVKNIVEGARKQLSKPIIKKEPITPEILHRLVSEFGHNNNLYDKRIVTMCLIGYAGFLRFSELAHIRA